MSETINLKRNEDGSVVRVVSTTSTSEFPLVADELRRQIKQHADVLDNLQCQLDAVLAFQDGEDDETEVTLSTNPQNSIVDQKKLDSLVAPEAEEK